MDVMKKVISSNPVKLMSKETVLDLKGALVIVNVKVREHAMVNGV